MPLASVSLTTLYDVAFTSFILSFFGLVILFHFFAPFFPGDAKRLSWILTTISSLTMSVVSMPFLWDFFVNGVSLKHVRAWPELAVVANRFFQAYLVSDLTLGCIYYRSEITLLAGWIHHPLYVAVVELAIRRSWSRIFCLALAMEIPTFVYGIATFFPQFRSNVLFASCFFMTRIMLHIILGVALVSEQSRDAVTGGSYVPAMIFAGILPLHLIWFVGCIKGFIRRARKKRATPVSLPPSVGVLGPSPSSSATRSAKPIPDVSFVSSAIPAPLRRFRHRFSHRRQIIERTHSLDPTISKRILISNVVSACIPRRETLYEWIGLGRRRGLRRRLLASGLTAKLSAFADTP